MMKCKGLLLIIVLLLLPPLMSYSKINIKSRLDSIINSRYNQSSPGISILVAKNGEIIYERQQGIADVDSKTRITADTRFNIASVSKQFTVAGIMALQDLGKLSIEDNVAKYFPEFRSGIWKNVKLKHLMSHTSGIPDLRPRDSIEYMLNVTDEQSIQYMVDLDSLKFVPGTEYDYINPTFQLFYAIINKISGTDFDNYQRMTLFNPAKMVNTSYFSPNKDIPNMAHGYVRADSEHSASDSDVKKEKRYGNNHYIDCDGLQWYQYDFGEETFFATKSDGGIYSTPRDMLNWEIALRDNICISREAKEQAYTPHITVTGSPYCEYQNRANTAYGYGWFIDTTPGFPTKIYHTGDNGGFQIYVGKYPEEDIVVIIFENRNDLDRWSFVKNIDTILQQEGLLFHK